MKNKNWIVKKINRRLSNVEGNRITARERKAKRIVRWTLIAVLSWVIPLTAEMPSSTIVFENKSISVESVSERQENSAGITVVSNGTGVDGENEGNGSDVVSKIVSSLPEPHIAVAIAKAESGLNPKAESITDRMPDGRPFSYGLFQINLTVSTIDGVQCHKAFQGRNYTAKVIDERLFSKCVNMAKDVDKSIEVAKAKYYGRGDWTAWGTYTSGVYKRFL